MKKTLLFTMMLACTFAYAQQAGFRHLIKNETTNKKSVPQVSNPEAIKKAPK